MPPPPHRSYPTLNKEELTKTRVYVPLQINIFIHLFLIIPPENSFYCPKLSQIFTICVVREKFSGGIIKNK